jgi:thymidylate kinase
MSELTPKLIVLEGADGTGKSTLAKEIAEQSKGHVLHGSWHKDWQIDEYHDDMYQAAEILLQHQTVVMDRWAPSEEVYSEAFRGGAEYSSDEYMRLLMGDKALSNTVFIYCENDNAVENHIENMKVREELFDDMSPVVREYEKYLGKTAINWIRYDFNKVNTKEFVEGILK